MDLGITIPNFGPLAEPVAIAAIIEQAEALGFNHCAIADHIVIPKSWASTYPYAPTGDRIETFDGGDCLEPLALMATVAGMSKTLRMVTAVLVIPYRPPILTAKQLATIDVLSNGRVILGCGTGWMREEFEAIGAPPFEARGRVTDDYIEAFRACWTSEEPEFHSEHATVSGIYFRPQPVQKPHPPIWIGGDTMPALRRTARLGDGWLPVGLSPRNPIDTVARYRGASDQLETLAREAGRDADAITRAFWAVWYDADLKRNASDGTRQIFTGEPSAVADDLHGLGDIGVKATLFNFIRPTLAETLAATERFATEVMQRVGR